MIHLRFWKCTASDASLHFAIGEWRPVSLCVFMYDSTNYCGTYIHGLRSPTTLALIVQKRDSAKTMNGAKGQDARVSKIDYIYYFTVWYFTVMVTIMARHEEPQWAKWEVNPGSDSKSFFIPAIIQAATGCSIFKKSSDLSWSSFMHAHSVISSKTICFVVSGWLTSSTIIIHHWAFFQIFLFMHQQKKIQCGRIAHPFHYPYYLQFPIWYQLLCSALDKTHKAFTWLNCPTNAGPF